jgi:alpha-L-rhamnosidase
VAEINGQNVGTHVLAPGWTSYGHRLTYQTFDVSNMLKPGSNAICATVGAGWYCGRLGFGGGTPNIWGDRVGLSAQLVVQYQDGTQEIVVTDDKWKWSTGSITSPSYMMARSATCGSIQRGGPLLISKAIRR